MNSIFELPAVNPTGKQSPTSSPFSRPTFRSNSTDDPPIHTSPAIDKDDTPTDFPTLNARLNDLLEKASARNPFQMGPERELVAEVSRLVREIGRLGPGPLIDSGLGALIGACSQLAWRLNIGLAARFGQLDLGDGGREGADFMRITPEVATLLQSVSDVSQLLVNLSGAYAKFKHVSMLGEKGRANR